MIEIPITSIFAAILSLLLIVLSVRVGIVRYHKKIWLLDGGDEKLTRTLRVQGNFIEYVPISITLLALVELGGASSMLVWGLGAGLLLSRLTHAIGLSLNERSIGRGLGANGTFLVILVSAGWLLSHNLPLIFHR
ncbi:MAPEG family protein [Porticoccaceae bacterium]|nr:MAPEG family protein [Porticoccaceae bacterium]